MNKTILLVEDDNKDEVLILRSLKNDGIVNEVFIVRDGAEAVDYLMNKENELPTIVLLDLKLPKLSGHEVLKRIRSDERTKLLPVIILTSSDEDKDILESYSHGANSYVCKPVKFDEFSKAVRAIGLFWLLTNKETPVIN